MDKFWLFAVSLAKIVNLFDPVAAEIVVFGLKDVLTPFRLYDHVWIGSSAKTFKAMLVMK